MTNITRYPYFSYNSQVELLMQPLKGQADLNMIGFCRRYKNHQRFIIDTPHKWCTHFYENELYRYSLYEKDPKDLVSTYDMWDHLPYSPPEIYKYRRTKFSLAHGLTIVKQHESCSDTFMFATHPLNSLINNFYINEKELFENFVAKFYETLAPDLEYLSQHRFYVPGNYVKSDQNSLKFTQRQYECASLVLEGYTTKEIAEILTLSPRTVEQHIDRLREKLHAKNRSQLSALLKCTI
jgi:DNA-binding CsgD family transcriptional regulator